MQIDQNATEKLESILKPRRRSFAGGAVFGNVYDEGRKVVLECYARPTVDEMDILRPLIHSVVTPQEIYWKQPCWQQPCCGDEEILLEVTETVNQFQTMFDQLQQLITDKANQDIQTIVNLAEKTRLEFNRTLQMPSKLAESSLSLSKSLTSNVSASVANKVDDLKQFWSAHLVHVIESIDLRKSKEKVKNLQDKYPQESPGQIANRLIEEKLIFATAIAGLGGLLPGGKMVFDFLQTDYLLAAMIYEVACAYGYYEFDKEEILIIWMSSVGSGKLQSQGVDFLTSSLHVPGATVVISMTLNTMLFFAVGYAACEYFRDKSQLATFDTELLENISKNTDSFIEEQLKHKDQIAAATQKVLELVKS